MTSVFFFQKTKIKKVKVSVVAAQKTPKCFASSRNDCSKRFFQIFFFLKMLIIQLPYMEIV